jgi:aryl carrier-like protein
LEKSIADVWQRALGMTDVAVNENFFDLGGQSLLMLRVHQQLRQTLGIKLSIVQVFAHPTIAALAYAIEPVFPTAIAKPTALPVSAAQNLATQARARAAAARAALARGRGTPPLL